MTHKEIIKRMVSLENREFIKLCLQSPLNKMAFDASMDADDDVYAFGSKYDKIIYNLIYESLGYDWDTYEFGKDGIKEHEEPSAEEKEKYIKSMILVTAYFKSISKITEKFDKQIMSILDD